MHPYKMATTSGKPKSAPPARRNVKAFVKWSPAECRGIAERSLDLLRDNADMPRLDAVRQAVSEMPASRQKPVKDMAHTGWILRQWEQIAAERDAKANAEALFAPVAASAPATQAELLPAAPEPVVELTLAQKRGLASARARAAKKALREAGTEAPIVKWHKNEWHALAKAFRRAKAGAEPSSKDTKIFREVMAATLPADRQRKIFGFSEVSGYLDPFYLIVDAELRAEAEANAALLAQQAAQVEAEERARFEAAQKAQAEKEAAERAEREQAEREENERVMRLQRETFEALEAGQRARIEAEQAERAAVEQFADRVTLDELFGLMARKFARAVMPAIMQEVKAEFAKELGAFVRPNVSRAPLHSPVVEQPAAAPKKPRVFILGGRNSWHRDIEQAFDAKLDLTFVGDDSEAGSSRNIDGAARADLVIACTDVLSHSAELALKKIRGGDYERISGGTSSVKKRLFQYLTERGRATAH